MCKFIEFFNFVYEELEVEFYLVKFVFCFDVCVGMDEIWDLVEL